MALATLAAAAAFLVLPLPEPFRHVVSLSWLIPVTAVAALAVVVVAWRAVCRLVRGHRAAEVLTFAAAAIASVDAATGMWRFFGTVLHFDVLTRTPIFAFLEIATVTFALRARDRLLDAAARVADGDGGTASRGVDGVLMWVTTAISAVLSSMASRSLAEVVFRLATPLVAALLWERGLSAAYRRTTGQPGINWRFSLDRVLVWLGLAEPAARDVGQVAIERRITQSAVAIDRARRARRGGPAGWKAFTMYRARTRLRLAEQHAGLAGNEALQLLLVGKIAILAGTADLVDMKAPGTWGQVMKKAGGVPANPPHGGSGRGRPDGGYAQLVKDLPEAIKAAIGGDTDCAVRIHEMLASRNDYEEFCRWLAGHGGGKRMLAVTALYARRDVTSDNYRAGAQRWISALVPGAQGQVDPAETGRIAKILRPVWESAEYPQGVS